MKIGIVGLGLIGGSFAKAYREYSNESGHILTIYGHDIDTTITEYAIISGVLNGTLDENTLPLCDVVFVALYPTDAIEYLTRVADKINKDTFVIDLCGTKGSICQAGFSLADKYGFTFVGGHPMAGTHHSGYKNSKATMFKGAPMVIVPPRYDDPALLDRIKKILSPVGFGKLSYTTAEDHDKKIAFTSQLAHVVSNAYVKSPTAKSHKGFSAGSYKDLTRVARLNETMWTELFFENKDALLYEIDNIISSLEEYKQALKSDNRDEMLKLLRNGSIAKEEIDG